MRYKLQRNANGMITQCENADGGNIYAQREELNKKALENLQRPTPGKLGALANYQTFCFQVSAFSTGNAEFIEQSYNTTSTFPANATQTIMFGVDGANNKALYYNIKYINAFCTGYLGSSNSFLPSDIWPIHFDLIISHHIKNPTLFLRHIVI